MKNKPDLKPGDAIGWDDILTGNPVWKVFDHWTGDCTVDSNTLLRHWKFIKRIRRKKQKPEVKTPVTFECQWNGDSNPIHPVGPAIVPKLQPFIGKKTKVTIEVIE